MKKTKAGHNGLGYQHVDSITVTSHPPYKDRGTIAASAKAQWVLTDLVNMAMFLEPHVASDGDKYKAPVIRDLTDHLNDRIIRGGLKKTDGVRQKLADVRNPLSLLPRSYLADHGHLQGGNVPQNPLGRLLGRRAWCQCYHRD